jgi:hypothetical protein
MLKKPSDDRFNRDVVGQLRPVLDAYSHIRAYTSMDGILEQQDLQRLGVLKANQVQIGESAQLRGHVDIHTRVVNEKAGIYVVRLALNFTGAQTRHQTIATYDPHAAAGQADAFPIPEAEDTAGEVRTVEDGVESMGGIAARVLR